MNKDNYLIIWHDRHRDDEYVLVLNANYREAEEAELEVAKRAGWENEKVLLKAALVIMAMVKITTST